MDCFQNPDCLRALIDLILAVLNSANAIGGYVMHF